ncbi:MAG TPA: ABC transporter permease [Candidatus Krumholzibacteria bacterium]|nr:ABC transporter permease [Candidatus Krumholzibacteria bacterium]
MLFREVLRVALQALRNHRMRSVLTMLGIIIGVAAMITMVALGQGAQNSVQSRIESLGPDLLTIYPGQSFHGGVASEQRVSLTMDDAAALERDARYINAVVPELSRDLQVVAGNQNANVNVVGTVPSYVPVHRFTVVAGHNFTSGDDNARARVAVLGASVPGMLGLNSAAAIGSNIDIAGVQFEVVGVLAEKGSQGSFQNLDEQVLIPLQTARYRVMGTDRLRSLTVRVADVKNMSLAMIEIERVLRREHKIRPGVDDDFRIRRQADLLSTLEDTTKTFTRLLAGIAAVSLIVGGIGIMNIMLVSVTERTREIGVRKALGATRRVILTQFLVEALVLCLLGGTIGVMLGSAAAVVMAQMNHWNTSISPAAIGLAFVFSGLVGVFFGMWPARRAANLDPIAALRYE